MVRSGWSIIYRFVSSLFRMNPYLKGLTLFVAATLISSTVGCSKGDSDEVSKDSNSGQITKQTLVLQVTQEEVVPRMVTAVGTPFRSSGVGRFGVQGRNSVLGDESVLSEQPVTLDQLREFLQQESLKDIFSAAFKGLCTSCVANMTVAAAVEGSTPTSTPTPAPTSAPTVAPTSAPTVAPTSEPTVVPTSAPTSEPTAGPTSAPTSAPSSEPTVAPTSAPTSIPTSEPITGPNPNPSLTVEEIQYLGKPIAGFGARAAVEAQAELEDVKIVLDPGVDELIGVTAVKDWSDTLDIPIPVIECEFPEVPPPPGPFAEVPPADVLDTPVCIWPSDTDIRRAKFSVCRGPAGSNMPPVNFPADRTMTAADKPLICQTPEALAKIDECLTSDDVKLPEGCGFKVIYSFLCKTKDAPPGTKNCYCTPIVVKP